MPLPDFVDENQPLALTGGVGTRRSPGTVFAERSVLCRAAWKGVDSSNDKQLDSQSYRLSQILSEF